MQGGAILVSVHGVLLVGILGGGGGDGGQRDAHELLGVIGRHVVKVLGGKRVVAGCDGVEEDQVAGVRRRRWRRVGVVDVAGVHENQSLKAIGWLDFRITMEVRRHRFWVRDEFLWW